MAVNPLDVAEELRKLALSLSDPLNEEYSYIDKFNEANHRLYQLCNNLIKHQGQTDEDEALICLSLLIGYNVGATLDAESIQCVLDRSAKVLPRLKADLLKCQLLTYCYGEVYAEELATEAHQIINSWNHNQLTKEQKQIISQLEDWENLELIIDN